MGKKKTSFRSFLDQKDVFVLQRLLVPLKEDVVVLFLHCTMACVIREHFSPVKRVGLSSVAVGRSPLSHHADN